MTKVDGKLAGGAVSRRSLLKGLGLSSFVFRAAQLLGSPVQIGSQTPSSARDLNHSFTDVRLVPEYPEPNPLADVLRLVAPGLDEYATEKYAQEIEAQLDGWRRDLTNSAHDLSAIASSLDGQVVATKFSHVEETSLRADFGVMCRRRKFGSAMANGSELVLKEIGQWLGPRSDVQTAEFEIFRIEKIESDPLTVRTQLRYDLVIETKDHAREEVVGAWTMDWRRAPSGTWRALSILADDETVTSVRGPAFIDVTQQALGQANSYQQQILRGVDHWRTVLDGAIGTDVYANNGLAVGDYDNDGFDDCYVCQPAGLPNRLYRNRGDGTFEDVTERAGVGVLDSTACALFADFDNRGRQDLLVVCGTGPLLFRNQGDGTFRIKQDAFRFARPAQGTFTHAAIADYDRDGRLDIYFCMYMYYLGLDQYHYPIPYYDARNGPPNCMFHNQGEGMFVEVTEQTGLNVDNDRYSFACAWGDANANGLPDLFVANDFGSSQLYRNNGNGTFSAVSKDAGIEEVGAGMGCCWCDFDNDGRQDVYVPSMWEAAGQRVSDQPQFHEKAAESIRALYRRHARGNALYRNQGDGKFKNVGAVAAVEMGRWSWSSDFWDFDHDGYSDLYVTNGYISAPDRTDLASFFWRQVVAKSSEDATPSLSYEHGWNAINELVRSDFTWHGRARNVMFVNNRDGTFSEASGPTGLDFIEDSRTFVLLDIDHDGRLEVILKNRNAPQLRILHNSTQGIGRSISFRLRGQKSNRDAIGTAITVQTESTRQTKYLQAGSGFLAQHSKEVFFGIGNSESVESVTIAWPSGVKQHFENLPGNHSIEVEEDSRSFQTKAFANTASAWTSAKTIGVSNSLPNEVETWLVTPMSAPNFSLPDASGRVRELKTFEGGIVLLYFWATTSQQSLDQIGVINRRRSELTRAGLTILAVNIDNESNQTRAQTFAFQQAPFFSVLFASREIAGIYNIVYRYMFDRRRDLGIPTSFLINRSGMIVKVYQGQLEVDSLLRDIGFIPGSTADAMKLALPFPGDLHGERFSRNEFTYGVAMFQHGYLDQAKASFEEVVAARPDDPEAHYNLGTLSLRKGDPAGARLYLERAVKLRPNYPEAWNNLGMIDAQQGNATQAIENFKQSLALRPGYAIAWLNLGNLYRRERDFGRAQDALRRAFEIQPDDPEICYGLGMLQAQQGDLPAALSLLQRAIALRPDYPEAMNNVGVLAIKSHNYEDAEAQFKRCIRVAPNFDQAYLNLARLYLLEGERARAGQVLNDLLKLHPDHSGAKELLDSLRGPN